MSSSSEPEKLWAERDFVALSVKVKNECMSHCGTAALALVLQRP